MEPRHERIAKVALAAGAQHGLALAGGYAVSAHGMGNRPSGDLDLFTAWEERAEFPSVVDEVLASLAGNGYAVTVVARTETFARLLVAEIDSSQEPEKVELSADWRAHAPVVLGIGPVLHPDDAVANKMCALYGRALPRDFLDIDAVLISGRYSRQQLLDLASNADAGFDTQMFSQALGVLTQITDQAFDPYDVSSVQVAAMRERFAGWRLQLEQA